MDLTYAAAVPPFLAETVALLVASAAVAYVCHRFGVMPIVSFLVTGALVGPHALGLVHDEALIESIAEVGVILLLFTIGLEFSLAKLASIKRLIFVGGGVQVLLVVTIVTGALALAGVDWRTGVFTGCLIALSSTAIVMKLLMSGGDMGSREGQASLGVLIFQDLAVVAMVLLVPLLGGQGGSPADIAIALGKAGGIVALVVLVARRVMPPVLEAVARTCSQEIFLLTVLAVCLGTAFLTSLAGVSLSLGAFLAGLVVSESRFRHLAFGEILPLQILFSALFFVSVGLLFDVSFVLSHPLAVLGVVAAVLVIKVASTGVGLLVLRYPLAPAMGSALILAQIGEFSFVLERAGREIGLFPAGVADGGPETFIAATVTLMIASPLLYRLAGSFRLPLGSGGGTVPSPAADDEEEPAAGLSRHVVIAGFGDAGRAVADLLQQREDPYLVVTLSPDGAREAERGALRVLRGNYTRRHELELAGIRRARLVVVADDEPETARQVVAAARALNADIDILTRVHEVSDVGELREAGATWVVSEQREGLIRVVDRVLRSGGAEDEEVHRAVERMRQDGGAPARHSRIERGHGMDAEGGMAQVVTLSERERGAVGCPHIGEAREVRPTSEGCQECERLGWTWVHLRVCMTCGHVGCCDSSRGRHATGHFRAEGHPIVRSLEPGDAWAWCYEDRKFL